MDCCFARAVVERIAGRTGPIEPIHPIMIAAIDCDTMTLGQQDLQADRAPARGSGRGSRSRGNRVISLQEAAAHTRSLR